MADVRRQSTTPKAIGGKPGGQGPGELDVALSKAIGARVKLITSSPAITIEGTIFTACPITNLVAIDITPVSKPTDSPTKRGGEYHLIPISRIQSFNVLSLARSESTGFDGALPSIGRVDIKALKAREEEAVRKLKDKESMRGKGVSKEGQDIFDALARTLPARWTGTSIVVNDTVTIAKPYGVDNCTAPKDQQNALTRVKKVLENEKRKLAEKVTKSGAASPAPGAVRKGG